MTIAQLSPSRLAAIPRPRTDRYGRMAMALLAVLGFSAMGGGASLILEPDGSLMQWTTAMLAGSPFADFLVPGLILTVLFGVGSMTAVALGLRHSRLAPFLAVAIGIGQMVWISVELAILGEPSFLHPAMFLVGLGIAAAAIPWGWATFEGWRRS